MRTGILVHGLAVAGLVSGCGDQLREAVLDGTVAISGERLGFGVGARGASRELPLRFSNAGRGRLELREFVGAGPFTPQAPPVDLLGPGEETETLVRFAPE